MGIARGGRYGAIKAKTRNFAMSRDSFLAAILTTFWSLLRSDHHSEWGLVTRIDEP